MAKRPQVEGKVGTLAVLFGDQLDRQYPDHLGLDKSDDAILMMEVGEESTAPPSHVQRTVMFLSAMRHHAAWLRDRGWRVEYVELGDPENTGAFGSEITRAVKRLRPDRVAVIRPGERRVLNIVRGCCGNAGIPCAVAEDPHFLTTPDDFAAWAEGRKELTMEYFYREQRKKLGVLMEGNKPVGGQWNYDKENRKSFKRTPRSPGLPEFGVDDVTREVLDAVRAVLPDLPGRMETFNWPVTRRQALIALNDFVENRLPKFGDYQDAMWLEQRTLYHALISGAINLKLIDPREVVEKAVGAYESGHAPLNAVEGFVRQIIGWREYIRGIYWFEGDGYGDRNALGHHGSLPSFFWTGETDMACVRDAVGGVLDLGYAHHISRLMVTGNFALIAGIEPKEVADWYLGMYVDGVDWVTAPNVIGMALHADGGIVGTKPYAASGKYIRKMSNACEHCRYSVEKRTGEDACPFNTFYWDFLIRHEDRFKRNHRMAMILKHVENMPREERVAITTSAADARRRMGISGG